MLQSLAFLLAISATGAQDGSLEIKNARPTYGYLGTTRPKGDGRLPGDVVHFTFDIVNMKLDESGRASYSLLVEVLDEKGHKVFKLGPTNAVAQNYLGGNTLPCSAHLEIPVDTPPGDYLFRVTVTDRAAEKSTTLESKGKVLPLAFGLVQVHASADREGRVPAATVGIVGESLYLNFAAVGFARAKGSGQPDLHVSMRVLDDKGQPTFAKPLTGVVNKDVHQDHPLVPAQFGIVLNRVGNFSVELEATDKLGGKTAKVTLPLRVVAVN